MKLTVRVVIQLRSTQSTTVLEEEAFGLRKGASREGFASVPQIVIRVTRGFGLQ